MQLTDIQKQFVLHWGEMGSLWGVNRTVAQIHALLFVYGKALNAEQARIAAMSAVSTKNLMGRSLLTLGCARFSPDRPPPEARSGLAGPPPRPYLPAKILGRDDMEKTFERLLFASRWLMAPMYLGLIAVLGMLLTVFLRQTLYYVPQALTMSAETAILAALSGAVAGAFLLGAVAALGLVMLSRRTAIQPRLRNQFSRLLH